MSIVIEEYGLSFELSNTFDAEHADTCPSVEALKGNVIRLGVLYCSTMFLESLAV